VRHTWSAATTTPSSTPGGDAREQIGDFPMTIISNDYGPSSPPGDEATNVPDQRGWLVLSPDWKQVW